MTTINVLIVNPDRSHEIVTLPAGRGGGVRLDALYDALGCEWVEGVSGSGWSAYLDEEGKITGKEPNLLATEIANSFGWVGMPGDILAGKVAFFGPVDRDGNDSPVPDWMTARLDAVA
jgi:hypothetical protein